MPNIKQKFQSAIALAVALLFLASVPAFADHGSDSSGDSSSVTSSSTSTSGSESDSGNGHKNKPEVADSNETSEAELHQQGNEVVSELAKNHKNKSAAEVQKQCVAHKQGLETKFAAIVTNSQRIQDKIDDILAKAQAYQQANKLSPANWDSLLAAAQSAQTASATSITNLKAVKPSLDCNNTSVASDVATFKVAAQTTRTDLKVYRDAVKAVLQALRDAKTASSSTGGSNQ